QWNNKYPFIYEANQSVWKSILNNSRYKPDKAIILNNNKECEYELNLEDNYLNSVDNN
ncbi:5181_t:CDS:1, partial [Dentiscutata erythropus]